ncbi:MAG: hypothetical protein K9W44_06500 [Candidatus Lokiarchaeota archaeon]|nr:hypothetical protein [Candidatus Harpocratesius repetitus]
MYLFSYILQNFQIKKKRTKLRVGAITFALISSLVMGFLVNIYLIAEKGFFSPFENYDQIVESGTSFTQFLPVASLYNQEFQSKTENILNHSVYPALIISNTPFIVSFHFSYVIGMPFDNIDTFWQKNLLAQGEWPQSPYEVVVGWNLRENSTICLRGNNLSVVGVFEFSYSFLDLMILTDLEMLQNITNHESLISVMYVPRSQDPRINEQNLVLNKSKIDSIEALSTQLDYLTPTDIQCIQSKFQGFIDSISQIFILLSTGTALFFVMVVNIIQFQNQRKDFLLFSQIGMKTSKIYLLYWFENGIILALGLILGVPISIGVFTGLYCYIRLQSDLSFTMWQNLQIAFWILKRAFPFQYMMNCIAWISCFYVIMLVSTTIYDFLIRKSFVLNKKIN